MTLFELSYILSPVGGAVGAAMAAHQQDPTHPETAILITGILAGLVCGYFIYRGLIRLVTWKLGQKLSSWRAAGLLGAAAVSPYLAAFICFCLARVVLHVAA